MVNQERLVGVLVDFARNLVGDYRIEPMLDALCVQVAQILPVSGAGVMLTDAQGVMRFVAASDEVVREIETLQIELNEGPCLAAYLRGEQVVIPDLEASAVFPRFGPRAVKAGLRGVYSFPMGGREQEQIGALNLYSAEPGDLDESDQEAGQLLADVATSYILHARAFEESVQLSGQLQHALNTRVTIEQAKGRLAEQLSVSVTEAFEVLRGHARRQRVKVHEVAREVVEGRLRLGDP